MQDLLAIFMVFSVPLLAIGGAYYLKAKKMSQEVFKTEERQVLLELKSENAELKRRMANMETILLDHKENPTTMRLDQASEEDLNAQKVAQMANRKFSRD